MRLLVWHARGGADSVVVCVHAQYKDGLDRIREQAIEKMEQAKRRDGLEFIQVDLASLKPRIE